MHNDILRAIYSPILNKVDLYIQNVLVARGSILKFKYHNNKKEITLKDKTLWSTILVHSKAIIWYWSYSPT
jgi:hypothetical protein